MPNMGHLTVDDSIAPSEDCLFYPTGHKKASLRMEFERTIQSYTHEQPHISHSNIDVIKGNSFSKKLSIQRSAKSLSMSGGVSKLGKKEGTTSSSRRLARSGSGRPREPLCYTKGSSPEIATLLREARRNESDLAGTLNIRT